jgi:hypothetical protein
MIMFKSKTKIMPKLPILFINVELAMNKWMRCKTFHKYVHYLTH